MGGVVVIHHSVRLMGDGASLIGRRWWGGCGHGIWSLLRSGWSEARARDPRCGRSIVIRIFSISHRVENSTRRLVGGIEA